MRLTWPLTGRAGEMGLVESALSEPASAGIVVSAAAGVGKSRLMREALGAAAARGCEVRTVIGTSSARRIPLGALAPWAGVHGGGGVQLICGVIESLVAAHDDRVVVMGVDDVHLLDDVSVFVLHQIVQRRAARLVLTFRAGEPVPEPVQDLWKVGDFDWLNLQLLSSADTAALLEAVLGAPPEPDAVSRLHRLTLGNPLYLRHIVEQEVGQGRLVEHQGWWRWTGEPVVPQSLAELIDARIGSLPAGVGTVVDALAVGEPIGLSALQRIADPGAVEDADERGLISVEHRGKAIEVRVAHPLYGEVRRSRAAPTRLRRLRGLVACELAAGDDRDDVQVLVRRAALSLDSDLVPDGALLTAAAHAAIRLADLPLADRLAAAAVEAGAGPEAQFVRAHALSWLGDGSAAEEVLNAVDVSNLSDDAFARFTYYRASNVLWALAEPERAEAIVDEAARLTNVSARRCVAAFKTVYYFAVDRPIEALAAARDIVLEELPPVIGAETAWVLANIHGDAGRTGEALAVGEAGLAMVRTSDAPHLGFNIVDAQVSALLMAGRVHEAVDLAERGRVDADDLPGAAHLLGSAIAGRAALGAGRLDVARAMLGRSSTALSATGYALGWGYRYCLPHALALAMSGDHADAVDVLASLNRRRRPFRSLDDESSLVRAWVAAGQGAVGEAVAILREAARTASFSGRFAVEVACLQTAAQFGDHAGVQRLAELPRHVEGTRAGVASRFAAALRDGDAELLGAVSEAFEELGDLLAALDAAAHAAAVFRRDDRRGSSLTWTARAQDLAVRCGHIQTPALAQVCSPLPLTDREREIVALLGLGLSNRDIADRLVLSVRTVEGHIYKAMMKTDTASRDELGDLLRPRKPPPTDDQHD
ncbi:MAG: helix-turn-helix transcriptional regulator [Mycolicibacterium rufum]|nr:helix-turn-helix transcriptional regulator [Mycolicibacterium rufum]